MDEKEAEARPLMGTIFLVIIGQAKRAPHWGVQSRFRVIYVTGFGITGLIAGLVKIDFFPEKASTKFKYCLRKI